MFWGATTVAYAAPVRQNPVRPSGAAVPLRPRLSYSGACSRNRRSRPRSWSAWPRASHRYAGWRPEECGGGGGLEEEEEEDTQKPRE